MSADPSPESEVPGGGSGGAPPSGLGARVCDLLSLVKFSHSVFALPFALQGAWLAAGGPPPLLRLGWIIVCAVAARTAAMAFNRLVDRNIDAANPRTRMRELPAGKLHPGAVTLLVLISCAVFVTSAFQLGPWTGWLSFPVLLVLLGYSYVKRFSAAAHLVLGVALGIAPLGAWLAVRGSFDADPTPVLWLALAVVTWVAGFDVIYSCQDAEFDKGRGLHSIPARLGLERALWLSSLLHVLTTGALVAVGLTAGLGAIWFSALAAAALLLVYEHRIVRPDDLSRVDVAFFTLNGWVGVALFVGMALDLWIFGA